jgi:hypothetical protein
VRLRRSLVAAACFYVSMRAVSWAADQQLLPRWWPFVLLVVVLSLLVAVWWKSRQPTGDVPEPDENQPWGLLEWVMAYALPTCVVGSLFALIYIGKEYGLPDWWPWAWVVAWSTFLFVAWWSGRKDTAV